MLSEAQVQTSRRELRHDWLGYECFPRVGAISRLERGAIRSGSGGGALQELARSWEGVREDWSMFFAEYPTAMSASRLLEIEPLASLPAGVKAWLGPLAHRRWMEGWGVEASCAEGARAVVDFGRAITALAHMSGLSGDSPAMEEELDGALSLLVAAAERLRDSVDRLPREIVV